MLGVLPKTNMYGEKPKLLFNEFLTLVEIKSLNDIIK